MLPSIYFILFKFSREGLGEAYDRDIAFANALETFGGGHNDPISVAFGGIWFCYISCFLTWNFKIVWVVFLLALQVAVVYKYLGVQETSASQPCAWSLILYHGSEELLSELYVVLWSW